MRKLFALLIVGGLLFGLTGMAAAKSDTVTCENTQSGATFDLPENAAETVDEHNDNVDCQFTGRPGDPGGPGLL